MVSRRGLECPSCGTNLDYTHAEFAPTFTTGKSSPPVPDFHPGDTFAGRYTIVDRVGAGGMGIVYKARDNELEGQVVALKIIRPALARLPAYADRFRREVKVTRRITHPNICRVHDIGEWTGESGRILFLSMEWIEGETLQQLLKQTGMLREGRALEIAERITGALEAAHAKGVIHRDLKPGNVMIDRKGSVYVTDFGLALERGGSDLDGSGAVVGSPPYMAPEQRRGESVDERADLYALGLVLREMLTGVRMEPSPGLTDELRDWLNPALRPLLEGLLADAPSGRFGSASEVRRAIREARDDPSISAVVSATMRTRPPTGRRWPWLVALTLLLAAAGVYAVTRLAAPEVRFASEQSEVQYRRGMDYLRKEGDTLRSVREAINMLNRASDLDPRNPLIWAGLGEAYWKLFTRTRSATVRDEAERSVERALSIDPDLPEALFARAVGFSEQGRNNAALADLERVARARPRFAIARALMGVVRGDLGQYDTGLADLRRALELAPGDFRVHLYGGIFHERTGEFSEAESYYRRATELKPDSFVAWNNLGAALMMIGEYERAVPTLERAIEIEEDATAYSNLATAFYYLGRYAEALPHFERAVDLQPQTPRWHANLGDGLLKLGREPQARQAFGRAAALARERLPLKPLDATAHVDLALYCAKAADCPCALEQARNATRLQPDSASVLFDVAVVHVICDSLDEGLDWLEHAAKRGANRAMIDAAPELERLRGDPRFQRILDLAGSS